MEGGTHAGPLPLTAVTALNSFSSHSTQVPTEDIRSITMAPSSAVAWPKLGVVRQRMKGLLAPVANDTDMGLPPESHRQQ